MKEKKFVSLVVYLHNCAQYINHFLDEMLPVFEASFEACELVCVDDGSQDDTVNILKDYMEGHNPNIMVNIIHMSYFQGVEASMNAGRDLAIGDFVYEFDHVFIDYNPELIREAYQMLVTGNDIVAVSSKGKAKMTSKLFYSLYNRARRTGGDIETETFRMISRRAINRVKSMGHYIPYRKAVYMNCGLKTGRIYYDSTGEGSKVRQEAFSSERVKLAMDSFIYFTNGLERISAIISGIFLAITVGVGIYILYDFFGAGKPVEGWVSMMGFMALGFFGVFTLLTIIMKYQSVMLNLVFKQQKYLISHIEKAGVK